MQSIGIEVHFLNLFLNNLYAPDEEWLRIQIGVKYEAKPSILKLQSV